MFDFGLKGLRNMAFMFENLEVYKKTIVLADELRALTETLIVDANPDYIKRGILE